MKSWNWPCSYLGIVTDYFLSFQTSNKDQKRECYLHYVFFFNRTELVEGLSLDANFHPQPHSMSDYNVIPIF